MNLEDEYKLKKLQKRMKLSFIYRKNGQGI